MRSLEALRPLRARHHARVAGDEDPRSGVGAYGRPAALPAELAGECEPKLSAALARGEGVEQSAVPDVLASGLRVVFCGINPGRVSAAAGAHFANPRNDFWRLLHETGFTGRLLEPEDQFSALEFGIGLTNAALRTTPGSGDLRKADFAGSADRLAAIARELGPSAIAFVGKEAYRGAFAERPSLGLQERRLGDTLLFVLPSTSPANAAVPYGERLHWFRELRAVLSAKT